MFDGEAKHCEIHWTLCHVVELNQIRFRDIAKLFDVLHFKIVSRVCLRIGEIAVNKLSQITCLQLLAKKNKFETSRTDEINANLRLCSPLWNVQISPMAPCAASFQRHRKWHRITIADRRHRSNDRRKLDELRVPTVDASHRYLRLLLARTTRLLEWHVQSHEHWMNNDILTVSAKASHEHANELKVSRGRFHRCTDQTPWKIRCEKMTKSNEQTN